MATLYNEYLTGAEREAAIMVAESDAHMAKLNILFEAVDATLEANMLAAEAKVFAENGTYDDLTMLYTEAEAEATEKKRGIIASILAAIGSLFTKISNFLTEKFGKEIEKNDNIPESKEIDSSLEQEMNLFQKAWAFLKKPIETISAGSDAGLSKEELAKAWAGLVAEVGAVAATGTLIAVNREKIIGWIKTIRDEIQKQVNNWIGKLKTVLGVGKVANTVAKLNAADKADDKESDDAEKADENKKTIGDKLLDIGHYILSALQKFSGWISKWIGKLASAIGLNKKAAEKEADNTPAVEAPKTETESVSIFGVTIDSDELITESELSDEDYTELVELFNEL